MTNVEQVVDALQRYYKDAGFNSTTFGLVDDVDIYASNGDVTVIARVATCGKTVRTSVVVKANNADAKEDAVGTWYEIEAIVKVGWFTSTVLDVELNAKGIVRVRRPEVE